MIEVTSLSKSFHRNESVSQAFTDISFKINLKQTVVILGPSGSGKTTLLRCLNGLTQADSGTIKIASCNIDSNTNDFNNVRHKVGMVFQQFNLFPDKTVLENISLPLRLVKKATKTAANTTATELLQRFNLSDKANVYPGQLSGGQQQRIAIVRALALQPEILLLDEPTSALDPVTAREVLELISELSHQDLTLIIVSHQLSVARNLADRILFLDQGKLIADQQRDEFFQNPADARIKSFIATQAD